MAQDSKVSIGEILFSVTLLSVVVVIILGYQMSQIVIERQNLQKVKESQTEQLNQVEPVRKQLDALASGVVELSKKGNKNAEAAIETLKKQGIVINPPEAAAKSAATPTATAAAKK